MAWLFVRLKFRLTANSIRGGDVWSTLGLLALWLGAIVLGLGGGLVLALLIGHTSEVVPILAAVALQVAWVLIPVMAAAMDATLDPRSLELLPLTAGELGRGMLVAAVAGPGGLVSFLLVAGLGIGLWPGWIGLITVPLLTLLLTFIGVVSGRLATTVISQLLSGSRVGEIVSVVGGLVGGASVLIGLNLGPEGELGGFDLPDWLEWLAVTPSGAVGAAFSYFDQGRVALGAGMTLWGGLGAAGLAWLYGRAIVRLQTRTVPQSRSRVRSETQPLGAVLTRLLPSPSVRVAAAKELRYLRRDPRLRAQLLGGLVTMGALGVVGATTFHTPYAPFLAVLATWVTTASVVPNQFGIDGGSFWAYVVSPTNVSAALLGKNFAWALLSLPLAVVAGVIGVALAGTARYLVPAVLASAAVLLVWMAVGNLTSIYGAFPFPERQLFGSNSGASGRALLVSLVGLAVSGILTAPVALGIGVAELLAGPGMVTLAALAGTVYAALVFRFTVRWAGVIVVERRFQLIEALDKR